jgi:hypothetical protein
MTMNATCGKVQNYINSGRLTNVLFTGNCCVNDKTTAFSGVYVFKIPRHGTNLQQNNQLCGAALENL